MKGQALLPGVPVPRTPAEPGDAAIDSPLHSSQDAIPGAAQNEGHSGLGFDRGSDRDDDRDDDRGGNGSDDWPALHDMMGSLFVFELDNPKPHPLHVLGIDQRPLPDAVKDIVEKAQVVAAGSALLDRILPDWDKVQDGKEYFPLRAPLAPILEKLEERRKSGRRVVVLADGDPLFFGIGATLARSLEPSQMRCIPGVTALQQACASACVPWHDVRCVSLHGRPDGWQAFNVAVFSGKSVCVLTDASTTPDVLSRHLLDRGVEWLKVWVCEKLGQAEERVRCLSLREAASSAPEEFSQPCTVLLTPVGPPHRPRLGLADSDLAVEKGLITKAPMRAAALSLLRIEPQHVVWDIGSGSGAVALEACSLAHEGCVVAVERSAGRALSIRENRRRSGAAILEIQQGLAPDCFHNLPDPQRVFVGGGLSGDHAEDVLGPICHRLPVGGRVVVSCVLLGTAQRSLEFFRSLGWPVEMQQIAASEAVPLADDLRLVPHNPVFLIACEKV